MAYTKQTWVNGDTITANKLNHMEDGIADAQGGGGGTSDYTDLTNKPQINSVTLSGNKSLADLGIDTYIDDYISDNYEDGDSAEY